MSPDFSSPDADELGNETPRARRTAARTDDRMRKFNYRVPRFPVDLPVRLTFNTSIQVGRCTEISTEGMKMEVHEPLSPDSSGTVHLNYQGITLDVAVRVAHSSSSHEGLRFVFESDEQRDEVTRLVEILAAPPHRQGPVPLG
jgi:PilZ domain